MKKMITYGTPKEYQAPRTVAEDIRDAAEIEYETIMVGGKPVEVLPEVSSKKKPPKSKFCRKLKGAHQWGNWQMYHYGFEKDKTKPSGKFVRYCVGCNRKDMWYAPDLPGPHWERDLSARPPGYKEVLS